MGNGSCGDKKGSCGGSSGNNCSMGDCYAKMIKGGLVGGLVMFLYFMFSWTVVPWHQATIMSFKDEKAVGAALTANADASGIYVTPAMGTKDAAGPFTFMSIKLDGGMGTMEQQMAIGFLTCFIAAAFLTALLKATCKCSSKCPVLFSMQAGVLVAVLHNMPLWNWWHFEGMFTLVGMADDFLAVSLAGWAISRFVMKIPSCGSSDKGACAS